MAKYIDPTTQQILDLAYSTGETVDLPRGDTYYDDLSAPLIGLSLGGSAGTVDYNYDNNSVTFQPSGGITDLKDCVVGGVQYPHAASLTGKLYPHLHWEQTNTDAHSFTLWIRIQSNNKEKTTAWTEMIAVTTDNIFEYTSGTLNQITPFKTADGDDFISMDGAGISATVQFRITRTDANVGDIEATFFDAHYEIDSFGSEDPFIKYMGGM